MPVAALLSKGAPTARRLPSADNETSVPNRSLGSVFDALRYAWKLQSVPARV
jgi:hypothetical protein